MNEKQLAGEKAAEFIENKTVVGLGTGSTVYFTIKKLSERVSEGLEIKAVSTSTSTTQLANSLGIPLISMNEVERIDLTIDGADEIDAHFNGIKGGGGALLFEKIVANASDQIIWVVDSSKMVQQLGRFPLPIEVVPFGYQHVLARLRKEGLNPILRIKDNKPFMTDSHHFIIDLHMKRIEKPNQLENFLNGMTGIVEHGLFLNMVDTVIIGNEDSTEVYKNA
jgi:ribose 5-phosphate isomerase A